MLINDMKVGQEILFKTARMENGKRERIVGSGTILGIAKNNITLEGTKETKGRYGLKPTECYRDEFDLKMAIQEDKFMDKMEELCQKYENFAKGAIKGTLKSQIPKGQEMFVQDMGMKAKMLGARFKAKVGEFTEGFTKNIQTTSLEHMNKETKNLIFHTDLSKHEPGRLNSRYIPDNQKPDFMTNPQPQDDCQFE